MSWLILLLSFALSALLTWRLGRPSSPFYVLDRPNDRSLHASPVPRNGGLAILAAILAGVTAQIPGDGRFSGLFLWIGAGLIPLSVVAYMDDRHGVPVKYRLIVQLLSASLLLAGGLSLGAYPGSIAGWTVPDWIGVPLTLVFVIWMVNLYNFMDGIDGIAGGMALCGFGALSLLGWMAGHEAYALACAVVAAAAAGFLCFNFPPARIFMGDVGSSSLGFLAAALSLWGIGENIFPFWAAMLIFSPFIADASVTLLRRLWRREIIWQSHKTHYYQQLAQAGWGHRKTLLAEYLIMLGCAATAVLGLRAPAAMQAFLLAGWALFYAVFFVWISRLGPGPRRDPA